MIQKYKNYSPKIHPNAFIHESAVIIGQVEIDEGANIWPGVVLRGDMGLIKIGKNTSIQDGTIAHTTLGFSETIIGNNVTVGHGVILHGCVVEDGCLIGMGSTLLDKCVIARESFVAAASLVTGNKTFPLRSFICGSPAKVLREANEREQMICISSVQHYLDLAKEYRAMI